MSVDGVQCVITDLYATFRKQYIGKNGWRVEHKTKTEYLTHTTSLQTTLTCLMCKKMQSL